VSFSAGTLSEDARTLASSQKEWFYIWDVESGTLRRKFPRPASDGGRLTIAPDGRTLATSHWISTQFYGEETIRLYDIEAAQPLFTLEPSDGRAYLKVFSPDGQRLFTGFLRGSGVVWDVRRNQLPPKAAN
jgi:WD40 repeat protein